jgi:hypothetical protein
MLVEGVENGDTAGLAVDGVDLRGPPQDRDAHCGSCECELVWRRREGVVSRLYERAWTEVGSKGTGCCSKMRMESVEDAASDCLADVGVLMIWMRQERS